MHGMQELAVLLQSRVSEVLHVDIHPAAKIGRGILMDHATGIVIGETAVVGDNVSLLHQVTLGGSGTGKGVRHPHVGENTFPWQLPGNSALLQQAASCVKVLGVAGALSCRTCSAVAACAAAARRAVFNWWRCCLSLAGRQR